VINTLFSTSNIFDVWSENMNVYLTLFLFIVYKFIFTAISLGLPIPCGLFIPVFIIGATGGRLIGISLIYDLKDNNNNNVITLKNINNFINFFRAIYEGEFLLWALPHSGVIPGGYAVVGAAAMSAGVTRTLSTSIIVFEMTGQLELLIPVLVCFHSYHSD
jgi:chloride channel 2